MKKLLLFITLLASLLFVTCQKDGGLAGTNWQYENTTLQLKAGGVATIIRGNTDGQRYSGQYTVSGNKVTFKNLVEDTELIIFYYDYGEINGNMMDVTYHYSFLEENTVQTRTFTKLN